MLEKVFTSWWGRRWSQECVWTWPLVMGYGRLCRHQHFIYIHEVQVPIGILILSSGRYGSTGRDPFSNEYHLRVLSDLQRSKILWHYWSRTLFPNRPVPPNDLAGQRKMHNTWLFVTGWVVYPPYPPSSSRHPTPQPDITRLRMWFWPSIICVHPSA